MPWPYCVILTAVQLNSGNAEIRPATTLVLPTLRECPPMTMMAIKYGFRPARATQGRERTTEDGLLTFSPAAPKSRAASDTPARAAPEFPKMSRPCHAKLYGAERRPGRPA